MNLLLTDIIYQKIFDSLNEAVAIIDELGVINVVNTNFSRLTGYSKEEWVGKEGIEIIVPIESATEYVIQKNQVASGKASQMELFLRKKNGEHFWAVIKENRFYDDQESLIGKVLTIADITKDKKQLDQIKQGDERLRFLLEASSEGIIIHEKGIITDVNDGALKLLGFSSHDLIGKSVFEFTPAKDHPKILDAIHRNSPVSAVREVFDKEGKTHHVEVTGKTIVQGGRDIRVLLLKDVTELQEKITEEQRLISIIEASPYLIAMMDKKGLRYINRSGRKLLGHGEEEDLTHLGVKDLISANSTERLMNEALPQAIREGVWNGQMEFKTKDGSDIPVSQTILAHVGEDGDVDFFSTIAENITGRLKVEKSLNESRERLKYFMEESREAIIIHEDGTIVDYNHAACKMFGYTQEELRGQSLFQLYDVTFHKELKKKMMTRELFEGELSGVKKDGTKFDIEVYSRPNFYRGKEVRIVSIMNIGQRKLVERALRSSEVRLNAAVEGTNVGIWDWNLITNGVTFNESWRKIFGISVDDMPKFFDEWKLLIHPQDLPELLSTLKKHLYSQTPMFQQIYRAKRAAGDYIVIEAKGKLVRDENNMPVRIVGTAVDITERQLMEDAVRKSQAQLTALIENREESIWSVDTELRILNFNKPVADVFKLLFNVQMQQGELITKGLPEEVANRWTERFHRTLKGEPYQVVDRFEFEGKEFFAEFILNPIRVDNGDILGVSVLGRNITQQKNFEKSLQEAKEQAEAANRTKSQFLANMSHEIRTPMNGVIGFTDLLLQSKLTSQQREYLDIVRHSADSLLSLINDLLDISKIESGKLELVSNQFNLKSLLRDIVKSFKVKAKEQQLKIVLDLDDSIPQFLEGDEMRLQQVLVNLLSNALKFSKAGKININASLQSQAGNDIIMFIEVIDQGIGIEKEKQEIIFQPFSQIDNMLTRKYGGTGLGLSIAKKIVTMMDGDIGVESEPGQGSRFYFTVKLKVPEKKI